MRAHTIYIFGNVLMHIFYIFTWLHHHLVTISVQHEYGYYFSPGLAFLNCTLRAQIWMFLCVNSG